MLTLNHPVHSQKGTHVVVGTVPVDVTAEDGSSFVVADDMPDVIKVLVVFSVVDKIVGTLVNVCADVGKLETGVVTLVPVVLVGVELDPADVSGVVISAVFAVGDIVEGVVVEPQVLLLWMTVSLMQIAR